MNITTGLTAALLGCAASGALAQGFTGAEVSLGYSTFTGDYEGDALNLGGSGEFALTRQIGVQLDFGYTDFGEVNGVDDSDLSALNFTLHAVYTINESGSVGLFYGREELTADDGTDEASDSSDFVGVELGYAFDAVSFEMYYAKALDELIDDAAIYGVSGAFDVNGLFEVTADYDRVDSGSDIDASSASVGIAYEVLPNITLEGEIGSAGFVTDRGDLTETFVGIGATYTFGAEGGATFDRRGLAREVPGF